MLLEATAISAPFVVHIEEERSKLQIADKPIIGLGEVRDWCIDAFHTNLIGRKPGLEESRVVVGGGRGGFYTMILKVF